MSVNKRIFDYSIYELEYEDTYKKTILLLKENKIFPDAIQQQMLFTHLKAMVIRSYTKESLPEIEVDMFEDISPLSHKLSADVVSWFPTLAYEETYLLSVHFEVAKENELTCELGA
ncbi:MULTISPECIES: transcriptional regulator [unclassified Photobacterium]|uniref:transcriptional regulator n=1 Tax=unclassified Photobacterium TaxID=2628852 RepID=UPI001EDEC2E1|nr:transcriptional regulator [Photobacterium sp. Ph6]MCG3877228.1 transcriptional regulator [Photobacterium sp. Ph5]